MLFKKNMSVAPIKNAQLIHIEPFFFYLKKKLCCVPNKNLFTLEVLWNTYRIQFIWIIEFFYFFYNNFINQET